MNKNLIKVLIATFITLFATSCVDDNYDLDDIDTTVGFRVNNLEIPINLDRIELSSILDLDSESQIKEIDGSYALFQEGDIESGSISIGAINISSPSVSPIRFAINAPTAVTRSIPAIPISNLLSSFTYSAKVDKAITGMKNVGTSNFTIKIRLSLTNASSISSKVTMKNLVLQAPAGLVGSVNKGTYDSTTGKVNLGDVNFTNGTFDFEINITKINLVPPTVVFDAQKNLFTFSTQIGIASAEISLDNIQPTAIPQNMSLDVNFDLSDLNITSFSGRVKYEIEGFNVNPVTIDDLPDVLSQSTTSIGLTNPQIYLSLTNPLDKYNLYATANLGITPNRETSGTTIYPNNGIFNIGKNEGNVYNNRYNYCLSPLDATASMAAEYPNAKFIEFTALSDVLAGEGLPQSISIKIENPEIPNLDVTDLLIGSNLGVVTGNYTFVAPLAFTKNSQIVYQDKDTSWGSEDLEDITIETLEVTAKITNDLPLSISLSAVPLDKDGNQINNVKVVGADITGSTTSDIVISITGEIKNLGGIQYKAVATVADENIAIAPTQGIKLTNIRAKVSGYYENEL